jgi:hypothetical protein
MARKRKKKKAVSKRSTADENGKARLNLMIDAELKDWAHDFASRRGKSLSGMVVEYFIDLRQEDEAPDVPQI